MRHRYILFLVLGLCIFSLSASAQVSTATTYATVTDASGAVISGASVTLNNLDTGATITRKTNEVGAAAFDFRRIGHRTMGNESHNLELTALLHSAGGSPRQRVRVESLLSGRSR